MVLPEDLRQHLRDAMRRVAREVAARRRRVKGTCAICGKEFEGTTRRMYCSNTCAVRAYRRRKKAAPPGPDSGP